MSIELSIPISQTMQFRCHNGLCIAYLLDIIYLELVSVLKYFAEVLSSVNLLTKFVDGVCSVNMECTHDSGFVADLTHL